MLTPLSGVIACTDWEWGQLGVTAQRTQSAQRSRSEDLASPPPGTYHRSGE